MTAIHCTICGGLIYRPSTVLPGAGPAPTRWLHARREDWTDNPHNATPPSKRRTKDDR